MLVDALGLLSTTHEEANRCTMGGSELTVPWENAIEEAYERKKLRYTELATDAQQRGWNAKVYPVEVGCRGFVASSTIRLLKDLGIHGFAQGFATDH
ncbi:hypothetical protein AOLI_G00251630 [Acnodon oligacanthus]